MSIGSRLKELRTEQGRTLKDVSAEAGIPLSCLARLERGEHDPGAPMLIAVLTALKQRKRDIDRLLLEMAHDQFDKRQASKGEEPQKRRKAAK